MSVVQLGDLMAAKVPTLNPADFKDEDFELWSIPAFDTGAPEILTGNEIGSAKKVLKPDDVLLSRIVPHIRRSWVVLPNTNGLRQIGSGEWIVFRSNRVSTNYLRHFLISDVFHSQFMQTVAGVGGSLLRARPDGVKEISLYLPPLEEQRRIAAILDQADALRKARRRAITRLNDLSQSVFYEMFGDPVSNTNNWNMLNIENVTRGKYGIKAGPFGSALKKEEYTTEGYRVYGQEQVIAGDLSIGNYYISKRKFEDLSSCSVMQGDILLSLVGSFGKVLVVPEKFQPGIINPRLLKISPNSDLIDSDFLAALMRTSSFRDLLNINAHGGTMGILNAGLVKRIKIIIPPLQLQKAYVNAEKILKSSLNVSSYSLTKLDILFSSLQHRAFNGELTGSAEELLKPLQNTEALTV